MADINLGNDTTINTTLNEPSSINTSVSTDTQLNASISDINYIPGYEEAEKQRRENEIQRQANELDRIALYEDMEYKKETDYYKGEDGQPGRDGAIQYTAGTGIEITDGNVINNTQTSAEWGNITGTLSDQTDLVNALNSKADSSDIPTKVSDLTNDSGFIDNTVNNLTNYYLKTETYTKNEIDTLIAQIPGFNVVVVQTLPVSDIDTHTIYLVPKTGSTGDIYDEYLYINNAWELIGNTAIDLSDYVKFTNYASNQKGGVIKTDTSTYGTSMYNGFLTGSTRTYAQYSNSANSLFVSKGTLENVLSDRIPTKTSDLTNDSGFTTEEVAISTTQPTNGEKLWINPDDLPSGSLNPITNQYSVATDKGYSCDYSNGRFGTIIWESDNTTLEDGLVEIPINNYSYIEIVFYTETASNTWKYIKSTGKIPVIASARGTMGDYVSSDNNTSAPQYFGRNYTMTIPSSGSIGITFTDGYNYNGSTYSNRNSSAVPIKVIGYK